HISPTKDPQQPTSLSVQLTRPRLSEPLRNKLRDLIRVAIHHHHVAVSLNPERRQINPIGLDTSAGKGGVIAVRGFDEILPRREIMQVIAEHEQVRNRL